MPPFPGRPIATDKRGTAPTLIRTNDRFGSSRAHLADSASGLSKIGGAPRVSKPVDGWGRPSTVLPPNRQFLALNHAG